MSTGRNQGSSQVDEIGLLDRFEARAVRDELVAIHAVRDRVADEQIAAILGRELLGVVADDAGDAGRAVRVVHDLRAEAEAVVRLAEARVVRAAEQQVGRLRVAIGREQVAERIECQAERIHLAVREVLDVRAVGPEAVDVAAFELNLLAVGAVHGAAVGVAVAGVDPAVDAVGETSCSGRACRAGRRGRT